MRIGCVFRFLAILISALAVAVGSWWVISRDTDTASLVVPVVVTAFIVFAIHHGYLVVREYRWRRRRRDEADNRHRAPIPTDVAKPTAFVGVDIIDAAQHAALPLVPDFQGAMYARGVTVAAMPSVAVLIAAVQTTVPSPPTNLPAGLSLANVAVMITLIGLVWRSRNPSEPWVRARTRAELLRREQYLCLAAAGPYQNLEPLRVVEEAKTRTAQIAGAGEHRLNSMIALRSQSHGRWHDSLWTEPNRPLEALRERVLSYLHYRIGKQSEWFGYSEALNRAAERRIAVVTKASLMATVLAIAAQAVLHAMDTVEPLSATTAAVLTLVLPPICAFLLAVQELFSHRRLAASYEHMRGSLRDQAAELAALAHQLDQSATIDSSAVSRQFQAAVLYTEHTLTEELQRWRMLTHRDEYDLSL